MLSDRWAIRRSVVCVGAIEPMLQDRLDRAVGGRADVVAAPAGGLDAGRAITAREPQNAETGPEALLGVWFGFHDRLDEGDRGGADLGGADLGGFSLDPRRRPFGIAPVRAWHVLRDRGVAMGYGRAGMAGDADALVQDLDRPVSDARLELLADQA